MKYEFITQLKNIPDEEEIRKISGTYKFKVLSELKIYNDQKLIAREGTKFLYRDSYGEPQISCESGEMKVVWIVTRQTLINFLEEIQE